MILQRQHDDQEIHVDLESVKQYSKNNAGKRTETFIGIEKSKIDFYDVNATQTRLRCSYVEVIAIIIIRSTSRFG
jgi:hypothetical protein